MNTAKLSLRMNSDNRSVSPIDLRDNCHKKKMNTLRYYLAEYNYFEIVARVFIIRARQNQLIRGNL